MQQTELKERLLELVEPIVEEHEATIVDLELTGVISNQTLRLLIYKDSGITVDLCGEISREVGDLLDIEDPIPGRYRLEVTSPGLTRPLKTDGDFTRASGRLLKIVLSSGRTIHGRLRVWDSEEITIEVDGEEQKIGRPEIAKATIEIEF